MVILSLALLLIFAAFYLVGTLLAGAALAERMRRWRRRVEQLPANLGAVGDKLVPPTQAVRYKQKILEAGQPRDLSVDGLVAVKMIGGIAGLLLAAATAALSGLAFPRFILTALILMAVGFFLPDAWLERLAQRRKKEAARSLPDILDLLTISIEAGLGFDGAISKVVQNFKGVLGQEFFRFLQETKLGRSRKEAWRDLAARVNIPEINTFVLAVVQADAFGISIGRVLRVQAEDVRIRRRQRAEEIAMKAPVKVVFPLVLCIFPALMIVILGPAAIKIFQIFMA